MALHKQGVKVKEIAKRIGLGTRTIQRWVTSDAYPETNYHHPHRSRFDAYAAYVKQRWDGGCHNIQQIWREIKVQGYPHSDRALRTHTVGGFDEQGTLIAWCALLSDGQQHGVLLDVMVHPQWQKQGIGRALVAKAIGHFRSQGIRIIHVDFLPGWAAFYERCGFRIGLGGIYQL